MKTKNRKTIILNFLLLTLIVIITSCSKELNPAKNINLPSIFSDNMVLQRNVTIHIWGDADKSSKIKIQIDNMSEVIAESDDKGKWHAELEPMKAGGPHTLKVIGIDTTVFSDVMIGEVWLCSGQSNMEWIVANSSNAEAEIKSADYEDIRLFTVKRNVADKPMNEFEGVWDKCSHESVSDFSAVGYFFGRELYKNLNIPIGLIHSSWGGTPIESWMKYETLESDSDFAPILNRFNRDVKNYPQKIKGYNAAVKRIKSEGVVLNQYQIDEGNNGVKLGYANSNYNDDLWKQITLPTYWESIDEMDIDGAVWFRKTIHIPQKWFGTQLVLELGSIDDFDITYFNGKKIGATGKEIPNFWMHNRKYVIPVELSKATNITIAVRVFDHYGEGGFGGSPGEMRIYREIAPEDYINTSGIWKYKVETALNTTDITGPGGNGLPVEPISPSSQYRPAGLYNAMIYPLAPFALKGTIWYQGETNAGRAYQYRKLLPAMLNDWRTLWKNDKMFFGIVSLANFQPVSNEPEESGWAEIREAQYLTIKNDPLTSLAVTIDIGDAWNIHPKNKQDVGKRLAWGALAKVYGNDIEYSGPEYVSQKVERGKIILSFNHVGSGLMIKDNNLLGFSICGNDEKFVWANAKITSNNEIEVWSEKVSNPVAVRYNWANNPVGNLYNSADLPAIPFRTDNFEGVTFNKN
ncbi:MAG: sialate O-acetylesterase [Bacteroidota bacterium]